MLAAQGLHLGLLQEHWIMCLLRWILERTTEKRLYMEGRSLIHVDREKYTQTLSVFLVCYWHLTWLVVTPVRFNLIGIGDWQGCRLDRIHYWSWRKVDGTWRICMCDMMAMWEQNTATHFTVMKSSKYTREDLAVLNISKATRPFSGYRFQGNKIRETSSIYDYLNTRKVFSSPLIIQKVLTTATPNVRFFKNQCPTILFINLKTKIQDHFNCNL